MQHPVATPPTRLNFFRRHWAWWFTIAVLVFIGLVRLRLLNIPLERDEGEYAYSGQLMLQGIPPYKLAYNMKFPGTYAAYAFIMAIFGQTPASIHLGLLCVTTLTALLLFRIGLKLLDTTAGAIAATAYAMLAAAPSTMGLEAHATQFAALFATAGICTLLLAWKRMNSLWAVAGGLMFGLATLMKQHAALFCFWGLAVLAINHSSNSRFAKLRCVASFCAGAAIPFGLTCLILWRAGVFEQFWFWTVDYARQYVSITPLAKAPQNFLNGFLEATTVGSFLIGLVATASLGLVWFDERLRGMRWQLLSFGFVSFLTTCPGFFFRVHYFLLAIPAVALLAGCAISIISHLWRKHWPSSLLVFWPQCTLALMLILIIYDNHRVWFELTPEQTSRTIYGENPFPEAEAVAAFVRAHSPTNARIAILGSEPEIYFLSHRHSATGFIYTYALMEPQPFASQMQKQMIREIETNTPEFIVMVQFPVSWLKWDKSDQTIFKWWDDYKTNYTVVGLTDEISRSETKYVWGAEAVSHYGPTRGNSILIYQRKNPLPVSNPHLTASINLYRR
jgi:Dolichyl-phosphate-mannose-protein mannosyltransferase